MSAREPENAWSMRGWLVMMDPFPYLKAEIPLKGYQQNEDIPSDDGIVRDISLGPLSRLAFCCAIQDGLFTPANPTKAKDPLNSVRLSKSSVAPTLFRASIAGDMYVEPSS